MERKVTKLEHSHTEVLVSVDEKTWKEAQAKAFKKLAANVTVDGFRKGKAPENLVKSKIDQVKVMDEAINGLLPTIFQDIIEKDNVKPFARPKVDVTKLSDTELEVKFLIVTVPEVKLGNYKNLGVKESEVKVSDKEVEEAMNQVAKNSATLVVKEGEANEGDVVVMDFVGKIDGVAFDGGSAQNYELELGSHSFIPGFEEKLVGHKAGEHVDVDVTFPENYTEELKGKAAVFGCDIHEVKEKKVPELNDELVKEQKIANVETVEQLKEFKKEEIKNRKASEAHREFVGKLLEAIAKDSTVDIPEEVIADQVASRREDMVKRMEQSGLTIEQYLQILGQKEEDFIAKLREDSIKDTTNYLIMEEIGKVENVTVSDADMDFEMAKLAEQYKMPLENVKKALEAQMGEFRNNIRMQRIEDALVSFNK